MSRSNIPASLQISDPYANILGVGVHAIDLNRALEIIKDGIQSNCKGYVCVTGVHGVMEAQRCVDFRRILAKAFLVTPDGMPTVWVGKVQGFRQIGRVFGPDLMLEVCRQSAEGNGFTHFLYGGNPGVVEQLKENLERLFPQIKIIGLFTPPFRPLQCEEKRQFQQLIARLKPDIIWVGLSTPKQEMFMAEMIDSLECKLMVGVGAAFDIHTGNVNDAPQWMKQMGMQWFHRLCQEPSRLWKRYLINNSSFLWKITLQFFRLRRYKMLLEPQTKS